ncbi:putative hydrolase [Candidatus Rubidus massiliensis]|nr:MAG: hypothetical protein BGO10_10225 [Chlamydia sp. 32-24]CDZ80109.1 putative hydrolase [Candidatus Rubidus massiliensis]
MDILIYEKGIELSKATNALILLHGRGGTASSILPLSEKFCDNTFYIVAPQANNNTWYPYTFLEEEDKNEPWLSNSIHNIKQLIEKIALNIPKKNIFIMGFSQGACLTLEVCGRYPENYGGIIAFTGGLIGKELNISRYKGNFLGTKVFIGNSDKDPHVPLSRSQKTKEIFELLGANVTLKVYPNMPHTINEEEIEWVKTNIFNAHLKKNKAAS